MMVSEVARFRQQQAMQEEAARQALYGFAAVASHETITARMEQETPHLLHLLKEGKLEQAETIIATMQQDLGGLEEGERGICHTTMAQERSKYVAFSTQTETL